MTDSPLAMQRRAAKAAHDWLLANRFRLARTREGEMLAEDLRRTVNRACANQADKGGA